MNRLAEEKSPYLLQHAGNPVDWYAWGEAAFEMARKEDKPIFLSIGYSTCHWCHVMEKESFEDEQVAALMNDAFVSIKVDREERPDIDAIYMNVCQMMTGGGGWPLTIIMTPDKEPFFAGTYIPKDNRYGRMGMLELVPRVAEFWKTRRAEATSSAQQITAALKQARQPQASGVVDATTIDSAAQSLHARFDWAYGGFGGAPKFPTPHNLTLLLRHWKRTGDGQSLAIVEKTLHEMRNSGIYDQIGFGFHRYSTDARWLVPHFEKMLYDQALLVMAYTEAYQSTGKQEYARTAADVIAYVLRDMTSPEGGFWSAEDADSEGEEGKFYLWSTSEIHAVLDQSDAELFIRVFNLQDDGNFLEQGTQERTGTNILHLQQSLGELASELRTSADELANRLESIRETLFAAREKRIHPHKDDKVLTDWNGLMIAALAKAAQALDRPEFAAAAAHAADFVLSRMRRTDGRLLHRFRDGEAGLDAHVDDYAFMVWGLLELYEATFEVRYIEAAIELNEAMLAHFWDHEGGGLYFTADDAETLLVRPKETYDGAVPSGNAVAMMNLARLARLTGDVQLEEKTSEMTAAFSGDLRTIPGAHSQMLQAVDFLLGPTYEIVICGKPGADDTKRMLQAIRTRFQPNAVVLFKPADDSDAVISRLAEFTRSMMAINGKATAYVCRGFACQAPTNDPEEMMAKL